MASTASDIYPNRFDICLLRGQILQRFMHLLCVYFTDIFYEGFFRKMEMEKMKIRKNTHLCNSSIWGWFFVTSKI